MHRILTGGLLTAFVAFGLATGAAARDTTTDVIRTGNTSSASIPLALSAMVERGEIKTGEPVLLLGFGAGLCYAAQVITAP